MLLTETVFSPTAEREEEIGASSLLEFTADGCCGEEVEKDLPRPPFFALKARKKPAVGEESAAARSA